MRSQTVRVLGVDPGLTRCGVGIVDGSAGRPLTLIDVGVVRTPPDLDIARRLHLLEQGIEAAIVQHRPDVVAVERVFSQHNVRTVMGTAQASGIAMVVAARHGIEVRLHTPSEVKAAVTGSGRAEKAQVQEMVRRILELDEAPSPADAADALAIAITHGWRGSATVVPIAGVQGQTAAQRAWAEAAAGTAARAQAARRRLAR